MSPTTTAGSSATLRRMRTSRSAKAATVSGMSRSRPDSETVPASVAEAASKVRPTWNSGWWACERAGLSTSTSRSNGTSACANAARSVRRTCSSRSLNFAPRSISLRSTRVLTNMPTRSSSARSPRPAIGVPIAMSVLLDRRAAQVARAACTTMNRVTPCARATSSSARCSCASTVKWCSAPALEATSGRGRSAGSSI
ncbi:Uncharacterised protein [Mycobacteroides abscessus subsp. abscessus]|nr:Uncharacterised protein [Mycobacteroides abscessus subsp. abscessus]